MKKKIFVGMMVLFLVIVGFLSIKAASGPQDRLSQSGSSKIGVIEINGMIAGSSSVSLLASEVASANDIMSAIRKACERSDIKAVVLRINSPGGTAAASQEIGIELDKLRQTGKPIITSMGDTCASGGYWVACGSDYIIANGTTLTGSIGVIMELTNLEELYEKIGISSRVIKSGEFKDIGSPSRELTEEEHDLLQAIIDDSYQQFLDQVRQGRKDKIKDQELVDVADGRIFTGRQALDVGLVDSLGNYYDAIKKAEEMADLAEDTPIEILNTSNFWERFALNMSISDLINSTNIQIK